MTKISDVAREASVSPATVSRALNNNPSVDPELLKRVLDAAERLGYRRNNTARSLRRQSSELIALIIPDIEDYFCTAVARGAERVVHERGYSLLLCNSAGDPDSERAYLAVAESEQVAGVLLSPMMPRNADHFKGETSERLPIVAIDVSLGEDFDSVVTDSYAGGRMAADHLLAEGWTRPACVAGPAQSTTAAARTAGFTDAMAQHGLTTMIVHTGFDREGGEQGLATLLDAPERPDCVFAVNERIAIGVLMGLRRRGISPGDGLGLVTFDDAPWAPLVEVPLTVIAQPAYEMGETAARLLLARILGGNGPAPVRVVLPVELLVRESSVKRTA